MRVEQDVFRDQVRTERDLPVAIILALTGVLLTLLFAVFLREGTLLTSRGDAMSSTGGADHRLSARAMVIPLMLSLHYNAYGFAGAMPREGMDQGRRWGCCRIRTDRHRLRRCGAVIGTGRVRARLRRLLSPGVGLFRELSVLQ